MNKIKFVLDANLRKLLKYLRFAGFDSLDATNLSESAILSLCQNENRIFLSRKNKVSPILKHIKKAKIDSDNINEQIKEVFSLFDITYSKCEVFNRCILCNTLLEDIHKNDLPASLDISSSNIKYCSQCKKLFWEGTHFKDMMNKINF